MFNPNDNLPSLQVFVHFPLDIDPETAERLLEDKYRHEHRLRKMQSQNAIERAVAALTEWLQHPPVI